MSGYFKANDPFRFGVTFLGTTLFRDSGLTITGHPSTGDLTANLPRSLYVRIQGGKGLVLDRQIVTRATARSYAKFFSDQSNAAQIPWILGPLSLLPEIGAAITIVAATIDGLQRLAAGAVNSDQLAVIMADGGAFLKLLSSERPDRVTVTVLYNVTVGREARSYGLYSGTYGLRVND